MFGRFTPPLLVAWLIAPLTAAERPNIILMMADDMGLGDTSAYCDFTGNSDGDQLHTPAMERLARMGVRFTDAHTPSSRCTPTRYALLTGRYPWRNRMKHWVLFGAQGDPMIEADRPTIATLLRDNGYRTAMVGKWHVGLRYRRSDGHPADGWDDADLTQPLADSPLDHGFDLCDITSRSHGTSGPEPHSNKNRPNQTVGPGHIRGRTVLAATHDGKQLLEDGPDTYVLSELGGRHSDRAIAFLNEHLSDSETSDSPFFLYYACNSNHSPYTPDTHVGDRAVAGAARSLSGETMNPRYDFIYENDVALARLLDYLEQTDDPRRPGTKLIRNTLVIFTSDNGAERDDPAATGPFRSNKGSAYEGGHRVPFLAAWPDGGIGDGNSETPGVRSTALIALQDIYATFADILGTDLPDLRAGEKGAEDSVSILAALRGDAIADRPMFLNDHKESDDHAAAALRWDNPHVDGHVVEGQWKMFFDAELLREGRAVAVELFNLAEDRQEEQNRLGDPQLVTLAAHLMREGLRHRTIGGHRYDAIAGSDRLIIDFRTRASRSSPDILLAAAEVAGHAADGITLSAELGDHDLSINLTGVHGDERLGDAVFQPNGRGVGLSTGEVQQVDDGEALVFRFDRDVIVQSATIVAGNGVCGGFYRVGDAAPLAIYCTDADIDAQDQSGILSDIGLVRAGEPLRFDSSPHYGVEAAGKWRLAELTLREVVP